MFFLTIMLENAWQAFGDTRVSTHVRLFIEATRHNAGLHGPVMFVAWLFQLILLAAHELIMIIDDIMNK